MISGFIRRLKLAYITYNFFHRKQLKHNSVIYKKLGLKKSWFSPISSKDFRFLRNSQSQNPEVPLLDLPRNQLYQQLDEESRQSLRKFNELGYAIIQKYLPVEKADAINKEVDRLLHEKKAGLKAGKKVMFAFHQSPLIAGIGRDKKLQDLLAVLLEGEPVLFQSMNFLFGSELATHSDSFHMTTYPHGGLLGVWLALEDVTDDNGPLHYFPGSHLLPYYMNADYDNEGTYFMTGSKSYVAYEKMIAEKIQKLELKKEVWRPRKGDLMIWHANLFHGGEPQLDKTKTRKSMVLHYFKKGVICYHEITQRPALLKSDSF